MKKLVLLVAVLFMLLPSFAQVKVHSHNDYTRQRPFSEAYEHKVYSIEADIYLQNDSLLVAHTQKELKSTNTLYALYLKPIITLFKEHGDRVSTDRKYTFQLMIDIKGDWKVILPRLMAGIQKYPSYFDRSVNPSAISIVISGNRPPDAEQSSYPSYILFDGLPNKAYLKEQLEKIAMISDNFRNSSKWNGEGRLPKEDQKKLRLLVKDAHKQGKMIRFWASPDTENAWKQLKRLGADIINTDKVAECMAWSKE